MLRQSMVPLPEGGWYVEWYDDGRGEDDMESAKAIHQTIIEDERRGRRRGIFTYGKSGQVMNINYAEYAKAAAEIMAGWAKENQARRLVKQGESK